MFNVKCVNSQNTEELHSLNPTTNPQNLSLSFIVMRPSRIPNRTHKKWFVTFIDNHTRICWVYLLKDKSEVRTVFFSFYAMIQTQFQTKIQILRTDNGTKYFNHTLGPFLQENGILHQSSCVDTPQQNGVAERKNRHILEVARALMLTTHMPTMFWGDAILTATYLINRMPSRVLSYATPLLTLSSNSSLPLD